jgi:hypothetical protein
VRGPFDDFRRINFKVTNADLNLQRMVVVYEDGEPDRIDVRQNIPQGGESWQIDLRGSGKRRIRRIDFWYDTKGITCPTVRQYIENRFQRQSASPGP